MKARSWQVERDAAVRWLRWKAAQEAASFNDHEAGIMRRAAAAISRGQHCMEGPPAISGTNGKRKAR